MKKETLVTSEVILIIGKQVLHLDVQSSPSLKLESPVFFNLVVKKCISVATHLIILEVFIHHKRRPKPPSIT